MKRTLLIPYRYKLQLERPVTFTLPTDDLDDFLRQEALNLDSSYEEMYVPPSSRTVYPRYMNPDLCLPVYVGQLLPVADYTRLDNGGILFAPIHANKVIRLYKPNLTYNFGSERTDEFDVVEDLFSAKYLQFGGTLQEACPNYKPFRVSSQYHCAPDRIANYAYGDPELWWVVIQYNGLFTPLDCYSDRQLKLPVASELKAWLTNQRGGGTASSQSSSSMAYRGRVVRL